MKIEEAIDELQEDIALYESDITSAGDGTPDGDLIQALYMAINALEKQIPKKPILDKEQTMRFVTTYTCPKCGKGFTGTRVCSYCYRCGQKIDWSDEK